MPPKKVRKLPREFYTRANVLTVARELLGKLLVVPASDGTRVSGMIVETEAYRGPADKASHALCFFRIRDVQPIQCRYEHCGNSSRRPDSRVATG